MRPSATLQNPSSNTVFDQLKSAWPEEQQTGEGQALGASLSFHMQVLFLPAWYKPLAPLAAQSALWAGPALFALSGDSYQWLVEFVRFALHICQ